MSADRSESPTPTEMLDWETARRDAFLRSALAVLRREPVDLLPFEEVRQKLQLRNARYVGVQDVPLDKIVGSVDRYTDFTRDFLPRRRFLEKRWQRIDRLVTSGTGLDPVELYKVGEVYFVHDGNHRVSVARHHGAPSIEAYVWEFDVRVPVGPDVTIDDLLCAGARAAFLERTDADKLCPDIHIELTQADGYDYLLYEIQSIQQSVAQIDGRQVPWGEAVQLWCEMRYTPVVDIIRSQDILKRFPNRTEADLYLWLRRNHEELDVRLGDHVLMEEAAEDLAKRYGEQASPITYVREAVGRLAGGVGELSGRLVESIAPRSEHKTVEQLEDDALSAALLSSVCQVAHDAPRYRFRGQTEEEWEAWRARLHERLWDLLGAGERPRQPYGTAELNPEIQEDETLADGIRRQLIWINTERTFSLPLYLFLPSGSEDEHPRATVIVFPGHGTIAQSAGLQRSYQRGNALTLARAGFVTAAMELRGFGWLDAVGHLRIDAAAKLVGRTWYGLLVQDAMRTIDYLVTRPEVDAQHIGTTGIGAGGALSMYTAALDERVRVTLVNSYLGKYVTTCLEEEHCPCNDIPGIRRDMDMGDVAALIAPRPALYVNGLKDPATTPQARESFAIAHWPYQLLGYPNHARLIEPRRMGHVYDSELAVAWFRRWFG
ncbi:MAG: hypothetical protein GX601_05035 [Anaerolineales bacterium]|nr:hypothetical protein [Anaerolineales bacterium]